MSVADSGCLSRIQDPRSRIRIFPSRIRICIKEFKYFNPKNLYLVLKNKIREELHGSQMDPGSAFFSIPDPEVKKGPDLGSPINTCCNFLWVRICIMIYSFFSQFRADEFKNFPIKTRSPRTHNNSCLKKKRNIKTSFLFIFTLSFTSVTRLQQ
jgi:hypothetical protein